MTLPEAVLGALALFVALPAAFRGGNTTALGLVMSWTVLELAWQIFHAGSTGLQVVCDMSVIILMLIKPDYRDGFPYRGICHQFVALFWTERTPCDRIIGMIFPVMWALYVAPIDSYYRWWGLWWLAAAQFLVSGIEPLRLSLIRKWREKSKATPPRVPRTGLARYA